MTRDSLSKLSGLNCQVVSLAPRLRRIRYTCVIVDEAHRARRRKVPKVDASADEINERAEPNKLMSFLRAIGPNTKSMLLATATPVQLHPVEAWDLLHILSHGNDGVLGGRTQSSPWYRPSRCLEIATGDVEVPTTDVREGWEYVRDPMPSRYEHRDLERIRRSLGAVFCGRFLRWWRSNGGRNRALLIAEASVGKMRSAGLVQPTRYAGAKQCLAKPRFAAVKS